MVEQKRWLTDKYWLSHFNYADEVRQQYTLPERIYIHDVTLREAEQTPHVSLLPQEKVRIAKALDELGVHSVEVAPFYSSYDKEATKELVKMRRNGELKAKVICLCRWMEQDIDLALECGADGVMIECIVNPWTCKQAWGIDEDGLVERLTRVVAYAKKNNIFTIAEPWDYYKVPLELLERLCKSVVYEGGADHISISDTFGFTLPWALTYVVRKLRSWVPGIPIEHHGHNDFGLATMVMIAAVVGGAEVVHTSINAIGERAGNAATEEVAMAIQLLLGVETGIKLDRIYPTCQLVSELTKIPIARNKPIVGENEFVYGSSMIAWMIEQLGKQGRPYTMMPFMPELIGREGYEVILGRGTGAFIVESKLKEMGLSATKEQVREIVERVKGEAAIRKWSVPDFAFKEIVKEALGK